MTRKPRGASEKVAALMLPDNADLIIGGGQPGRIASELVATSPVPIVSMCVFKFVALADGVFERGNDGVFRECKFEVAA